MLYNYFIYTLRCQKIVEPVPQNKLYYFLFQTYLTIKKRKSIGVNNIKMVPITNTSKTFIRFLSTFFFLDLSIIS